MLVSTISPAPRRSTSRAQATASRPVGNAAAVDVDFPTTSRPSRWTRLGSMLTTMHWLPNRRAAWRTSSGSRTAAELIETLSAPALKSARISSRLRIPPPTVSGMKQTSAVRRTTSSKIARVLVAGRDVEENQLVGPLLIVTRGHLHRIAGVLEVEEVRPLDHTAVVDVKARNDPLGQHARSLRAAGRCAGQRHASASSPRVDPTN